MLFFHQVIGDNDDLVAAITTKTTSPSWKEMSLAGLPEGEWGRTALMMMALEKVNHFGLPGIALDQAEDLYEVGLHLLAESEESPQGYYYPKIQRILHSLCTGDNLLGALEDYQEIMSTRAFNEAKQMVSSGRMK